MDLKRMGNQTVVFANPPVILSSYSVVGPKEGEGPLKNTFNQVRKDQINGEENWEVAESKMLQEAMQGAIDQAGIPKEQIDFMLAGDLLLGRSGVGPRITSATIGRVVDYAVTDVSNMGAAMAPAVSDTILNHLHDLQRKPEDYDLIASGDLGAVGLALAGEVLKKSGLNMGERFTDCGTLIYDSSQDVHAGGSGCGCSAVVLAGTIMQRIKVGELKRVLFVGSGALHSPTSALQGESIPGIGHAVAIEA